MPAPAADPSTIFTALDYTYGLVDGSATWPDCLEALIGVADIDAARLHLYDGTRGRSHIAEVAGLGVSRGPTVQNVGIDEALWQSVPGDVWRPAIDDGSSFRRPDGLHLHGFSVLDRDNAHILYLELLRRPRDHRRPDAAESLLGAVLPHLHRACRLHRSISGDDLIAFTAPGLETPSPPAGLPTELRLRRRFRLSKAEARVATLLADGLAPRMIADRLNVSIHTVRSQLQAIFQKTDTSRQAELTSLILREMEIPRAICRTDAVSAS